MKGQKCQSDQLKSSVSVSSQQTLHRTQTDRSVRITASRKMTLYPDHPGHRTLQPVDLIALGGSL